MLEDTIVIAVPSDTEIVEVTKKKIKKNLYPGYSMWGNGKTTRGGTSMNLLDIVAELGKPEIALMQFFRDEMERNQVAKNPNPNVVEPNKSSDYNSYVKTAIKKHYAHMECLGIVKRLHRGKYMLNPYLYIPYAFIDEMKAKWDSLDKSNCDD